MSTSNISKICKDGASKSNNDVCEVNDMLQDMNLANDEVNCGGEEGSHNIFHGRERCANCGKEGSDNMNICNKCKMVKYCNASCKKKHRHKHKKECEEHLRLAAKQAAVLHDEKLFKEPPSQYGDCPICFERLPSLESGVQYMTCCGKMICCGCIHSPVYDDQGNEVDNKKCSFCRAPWPDTEGEVNRRNKVRVEVDDPLAIHNRGNYYRDGRNGFPQDYTKALELFHRSGELGHAEAYTSIGYSYDNGRGVEVDETKARHYYELAAMGGSDNARHNLGVDEIEAGNMDRAVKHFMIAVRGGYDGSLDTIKKMYSKGYATKDDYMKALQLYQEYLGEIKSVQRDKVAASRDDCAYY